MTEKTMLRSGGGAGVRVLLIEDQDMVARATRRLLARVLPGCQVETVAGVAEAKSALVNAWHDVVLSDFDIIGGTGEDVRVWALNHACDFVRGQAWRWIFHSGNPDAARSGVPLVEKGSCIDVWAADMRFAMAQVDNALKVGDDITRGASASPRAWL